MKTKHIFASLMAFATLSLNTSCVGDLDQYPHIETTSQQIYTSVENYEAVLGKIYNSLVTTGQGKGGDISDLSSNFGYDYMRCYFNLQECGTDEVASTWLSGDKLSELTYLKWDATDPWVADMYYRIYYNITMCNEFLRNATDAKIASFGAENEKKLKQARAEVRFMRALFYYHALDLYRNIPFVTENDPVGSFTPPRYTGEQIFAFIESELKAIVGDMAPASECPYARASQGAAYTLLAKLYLNAEVYTGKPKYTECIEACRNAIAQGYSLNGDYSKLFNADNDKRTNEIIFALQVDATHTISWGSTTYLVCGELSNSNADQKPEDYGAISGWGSMRSRGELPAKFADGDKDKRYMFFAKGQSQNVDEMENQADGYLITKWSNLTDDGQTASNTADGGVCTDFPLFRLADVYLMYAEAVVRGGEGGSRTQALQYVNDLRRRAYGDDSGDIKENQLTKDFIIDERARELYWEGPRRTDLVRFGMFTTSSYLWQWKGGTRDGMSVDSKYNVYPIPATELTANPNLHNDGY